MKNQVKNKNRNTAKLNREEQKTLESVERGEWQTVKNYTKELAIAKKAASNSLRKDARINIRLSSADLERIKQAAANEGLPYQTLITSILHKYAAQQN
jgi:predicted DNA binding CopG/RHH family protein